MRARSVLLSAVLILAASALLGAQDGLQTLHGRCSIAPSTNPDRVRLELESGVRDDKSDHCANHDDDHVPLSEFSGLTAADFRRDGAHVDAVMAAEAGRITCSGVVHDLVLSGEFTFVADAAFVRRMGQMGFSGFTPEMLEAYTLFHVETSWIQALQAEGVTGIDSGKIIALRIFQADPEYVRSMAALGYTKLPADKLIAFKVQGVNPEEVRQYRALGYQPSADELIQMRIFRVTPEFIRRMDARGLGTLTISKLVQIRIFNLAD